MKKIRADFNALTEEGYVSLETRAAREDLTVQAWSEGEEVVLYDEELEVPAVLFCEEGWVLGRPDWSRVVSLAPAGSVDVLGSDTFAMSAGGGLHSAAPLHVSDEPLTQHAQDKPTNDQLVA